MNCLEYRRRVATAPAERDEAMLEHIASCSSCAAFGRDCARFDSLLARAVRIPVPEGLEERILLRHDFDSTPVRPARRKMLALAASILVMMVGGGLGWWVVAAPKLLAAEIISLAAGARYALEAEGSVSAQELEAALRPTGVRLTRSIGEITFAGPCVIRRSLAGHIVLRGRSAKVTVFLMPEERVLRRAEFTSDAFRGVLLPGEAGAVAIVAALGESLESLEALEDRVLEAVRWPT